MNTELHSKGKYSLYHLSDTICVCGKEYKVETDFRFWLRMFEMYENAPEIIKCSLAVEYASKEMYADVKRGAISLSDAMEGINDFLCMGKGSRENDNTEKLIDFQIDERQIYSSFYMAYGIDLSYVSLHYHAFMALLTCLPEDSIFMQTVNLRRIDASEIKDDRIRRKVKRAQRKVKLVSIKSEKMEERWRTEA